MGLYAPRHAALALLATALLVGRAEAQEGSTIVVDCPTFDAESRAAIEARARADLLVRNVPGTFVVVCADGEGRLSWHPLEGLPVTATVSLDPDLRVTADRILEGLEGLVAAGVMPATQTQPASAAAQPSLPAPPATNPEPSAPPAPAVAPPRDEPAATRETPRDGFGGVLFGGGVGGELWSGTAALGPRASVLLSLPARFEAGATATAFFTLRSPDQVSGRAIRAALTSSYALDRGETFRIGADVFIDLVHATAPGAGTANDAAFGALLRATGALVIDSVRLELGPTLAIHPVPLQAQIGPGPEGTNGSVAFTLQTLTAGLVLDALVGPL